MWLRNFIRMYVFRGYNKLSWGVLRLAHHNSREDYNGRLYDVHDLERTVVH